MKRAARLLFALALLVAASARGDDGDRLAKLRAEIDAREEAARALGAQAEGVLGQLEAVDRELVEIRRGARLLRTREREAASAAEAARREEAAAERAQREVEALLAQRLVALYKWNATGGAAGVFAATDFAAFARRREGLARVLGDDRALFERHRAARAELERTRTQKEALLREVSAARREASAREEKARKQGVARRNLVALLRTRAERESRAASELREAAERLESAIANMPVSRPAPSSGEGLVLGGVPRPVAGRVRAGFGRQVDPEFQTTTLRTGLELEAEVGTKVAAVAAGRVLFAGWFRGYGQMVILDHGSGDLTVSGYLDEIDVAAGDTVAAGQPIGSVGETGSTAGPGLYFEIRHGGKAVDPELWLAR